MVTESSDPARCPVHGTPLERQPIAVAYGLRVWQEGYWEAREDLFPHSDEPAPGGCVIDEHSPMERDAMVCAACCEARDAWHAAHPDHE